jgi:hypothetical protein
MIENNDVLRWTDWFTEPPFRIRVHWNRRRYRLRHKWHVCLARDLDNRWPMQWQSPDQRPLYLDDRSTNEQMFVVSHVLLIRFVSSLDVYRMFPRRVDVELSNSIGLFVRCPSYWHLHWQWSHLSEWSIESTDARRNWTNLIELHVNTHDIKCRIVVEHWRLVGMNESLNEQCSTIDWISMTFGWRWTITLKSEYSTRTSLRSLLAASFVLRRCHHVVLTSYVHCVSYWFNWNDHSSNEPDDRAR